MSKQHAIEKKLKDEATRISQGLGGAPVVIIVGGSTSSQIPRTTTVSSSAGEDVLPRDILGLLQMSIQVESWKQFRNWEQQADTALNETPGKTDDPEWLSP